MMVAMQRSSALSTRGMVLLQALTAGAISSLANLVAQCYLIGMRDIDVKTAAKFWIFGFVFIGPSGHYWQNKLERIVGKKTQYRALKKVLIDQCLYGPVANAAFMVFISKIVENKSWRNTRMRLKDEFLVTQFKGWTLWPIAQLINQIYVPIELRVLWLNVVSFFWSTILITTV